MWPINGNSLDYYYFVYLDVISCFVVCSRRWGSLWSMCCGSSTVSFTDRGGIMESSPSNWLTDSWTHGSGVSGWSWNLQSASRPQASQSLHLNSHQTAGETETSCKVKSENVLQLLLQTLFITTVRFGGGGSVHSPAESQLHPLVTQWRRDFQRCAVLVEFYTGTFSTQFKFPVQFTGLKGSPPSG